MSDIEEKRVFSERSEKTAVYVASGVGVVRVTVSGATVGRFGVVHRGAAADVACDGERVAVAADDVYVTTGNADADVADDEFRPTGFGPATAVGFADGALFAGDDGGRVARRAADAPSESGDEWETVGETEAGAVRAVGGGMVAAADGVYRATGDGLAHAGLSDARDVTGDGTPLAATGDGLYRLGNGWMDELDGAFRAVAADGDRVHAAGDDGLFARTGDGSDGMGEWTAIDLPTDEPVADVGHAPETTVVVTEGGTVLTEGQPDWRAQALGVADVTRVAVSR